MKENVVRHRGNTTVLIVACVTILILLAVFAFNFSRVFGGQKQVQSAIDAAALTAATDIGRVVINDGTLGRVALVDDAASASDPHPIQGINTLFATLRITALIANKVNNNAMTFLATNEMAEAQNAANYLASTISSAVQPNSATVVYDKNGNQININADVQAAFNNNNQSEASIGTVQTSTATIVIGYFSDASATTSTPVPTPLSDDPSTGTYNNASNSYTPNSSTVTSSSTYKPYVNISTPGISTPLQFSAMGQTPTLVPDNPFVAYGSSSASAITAAPSVVQVSVTKTVTPYKGSTAHMSMVATAICGNSLTPTLPSSALIVSLPGGLPALSTLNMTTVQNIMNSAQINADGTSSYGPWQPSQGSSPGFWFTTTAAAAGASGTGNIILSPFKSTLLPTNDQQTNDNPSISLSFLVYDWVKSLGLRPNIDSVTQALTNVDLSKIQANLGNITPGTDIGPAPGSYALAAVDNKQRIADRSSWFVPPAYAQQNSASSSITSALLNISYGDAKNDPRNLLNYDNSPSDYHRQQSRAWGYVPGDGVAPNQARMVKIQNGIVSTTDGNNLQDLEDFWADVANLGNYAATTQQNGAKALSYAVALLRSKDKTINANNVSDKLKTYSQQALQKLPRLKAALINARYAAQVGQQMVQNMKTLTGMGVKEVSAHHYLVGGTDFYPPEIAGQASAMLDANVAAPDGQNSAAPFADWCAPLSGNQSQLIFFKTTQAPVIGQMHNDGSWLQPALAQSASSSTNKLMQLLFLVSGSSPGSAQVHMLVGMTPFAQEATLQGQQLYQDVHALEVQQPQTYQVTSTTDTITNGLVNPCNGQVLTHGEKQTQTTQTFNVDTVWQVQARDELANAYPALPTGKTPYKPSNATAIGTYFADMNNPGGASSLSSSDASYCASVIHTSMPSSGSSSSPQCPALGAEWQITECPTPVEITPGMNMYVPAFFNYQPQVITSSNTQTLSVTAIACSYYYSCVLGLPGIAPAYTDLALGIPAGTTDYQTTVAVTDSGSYETYDVNGTYLYAGQFSNATVGSGNGFTETTSPQYGTLLQYQTNEYIDADAS